MCVCRSNDGRLLKIPPNDLALPVNIERFCKPNAFDLSFNTVKYQTCVLNVMSITESVGTVGVADH